MKTKKHYFKPLTIFLNSLAALYIAFMILVGFSILFCSCGSDATNKDKCYEKVQAAFPNSKIYYSYDDKYTFVVVDYNGVKIVETLNITNDDISSVKILLLHK